MGLRSFYITHSLILYILKRHVSRPQSQISSEDWARKYQFDDVCWPHRRCKYSQSSTSSNCNRFNDDHSYYMMSALASAAVEGVLSRADNTTKDDYDIPCSTIIFAVGGSASGKTRTIFGSSLASLVSSSPGSRMIEKNEDAGYGHGLGLLGEIVSGILQHAAGEENFGGPSLKCSLSILEIVNADVLRDVLGVCEEGLGENGGSKALRVRHLDSRGAVVLNLRQATIETMKQLGDVLHCSFKSNILRRAWSSEGGHGHFIVTIGVSRPNGYCAKIQLADLAGSDRHALSAAALGDVRKSLSALRGVLRGLVTQHNSQANSPIPYRESTLTKLLQRSLDASTRSVVIGTVSNSTKSYNQTLATMDFMSRILAKAGETALSPFHDAVLTAKTGRKSEGKTGHEERMKLLREDAGLYRPLDDSQTASRTSQRKSSIPPKASLGNITSDPRQRLAKLLSSAPARSAKKTLRGVAHNNEVGTPKSSSALSDDAKSRQFRDNYGDVFTRLDLLMDADDDDLDRNSFEEDIIEALTPYKARATNDGSSIDSSEGVTPSPFRENFLTDQSDNLKLRQLEQKQREDQKRLDELYNGGERKDAGSAGLLQTRLLQTPCSNSDNSVGHSKPPLQTEIEFQSYSQVKSSQNRNDSSSRMSNYDSLDESQCQSVALSLSQIERTEQSPYPDDSDNAKSSYHKLNNGSLNEAGLSELRPTETHFQTETPELHRRICHTPDHPSMTLMAPVSISKHCHVTTDVKPQIQTEVEDPSVDSNQLGGRDASRVDNSIFVERKEAPPSMLLSLDSMDSEEPLVSTRGDQVIFFGNSAQQKNNPPNSFDVPSSPTYAMFESFKNEIDTLVVKLANEKIAADNSTAADATALVTAHEQNYVIDNHCIGHAPIDIPKHTILEDQIGSLTEKVQSLSEEKTVIEAFLSKILSIINEVDETQTSSGVASSWSDLEDAIRKRQSLLMKLESQLESSQAEKSNLSRELERAQRKISELSLSVQQVEKNLISAKGTIDSQAHASASLGSQIERLKGQLKDLSNIQHSSSVFFDRLDEILHISADRASVLAKSQHDIRLDSIKNLQSRSQDVLMKTRELEGQLRMSQESHTLIESKRLESEKLCEEAISASETLAKDVEELRSELAMKQKAHQVLLTTHNAALEENKELSRDYTKIMSQMAERDQEISRLNVSFAACNEEKSQLKDQLSSIRAKTVHVMKQHIEKLRVDYARRLEEFKAGYVLEHESEELSRLRLDLSNKEAENASLRKRMEHIEKSTSLRVHNAEEKLSQTQGELTSVSKEAFSTRVEKNAMQEELDHLRSLMDIAEESVSELNRLKEENKQLIGMIRSQNDQDSRLSSFGVPFEIRGGYNQDDIMHERISALMRENEQNNISMRTLQVSSRKDTPHKNVHPFLRLITLCVFVLYCRMKMWH